MSVSNLNVTLAVPYSTCVYERVINFSGNQLTIPLPRMSDGRGFTVSLTLNDPLYLPSTWQVFVDSNIINSSAIDFIMNLVLESQRTIGAVYNF
jgi:hypothetical protein